MSNKYILQYGNLAGWPYRIAQGLRKRGINCRNVIAYEQDILDLDRKLPYDYAICDIKESKFCKYYKKIAFFGRILSESSLIHYHHSIIFEIFRHNLFEGKVLAALKIPMLISFSGTDARIISMARKKNPYFYLMPDEDHDNKIRQWLTSLSKYIRYAATDCEMKEYVEKYFDKVFIFRQPVNLEEIQCCIPDYSKKKPIIMHIPTNPEVKGTEYIQAAVEQLWSEGLEFDFRLIRKLTQKQLYKEISLCDIYIDELRCGSHGMTAVEAMASGKPTITYIREDLIEKYPDDMPLVNANPETIYSVLKELILDAELRYEIGKKSRAYVEKYHAVDVVISDLIKIYHEIGYKG